MPGPSIATPSLLSALRTDSRLPANTWYIIASTAFSTLNRPEEVPKVFAHAIENGQGPGSTKPSQDEQLMIARRIREALLKASAVIGLPKTINAMLALRAVTPPHLLDPPMGFSPSGRVNDMYAIPSAQVLQRGMEFFKQVYGNVGDRVMRMLDQSGSEDLGLLARLEYGFVLSPVRVLDAAETSLVVIASLIPQDVTPQLKGHLVGALNNGATIEEVRAVRSVVIKLCEAAGMQKLDEKTKHGWGWREEVANLKTESKL